jgi:hypothetical protein
LEPTFFRFGTLIITSGRLVDRCWGKYFAPGAHPTHLPTRQKSRQSDVLHVFVFGAVFRDDWRLRTFL